MAAKSDFDYVKERVKDKKIYRIQWKNSPVDAQAYKILASAIKKSTDYSPMTREKSLQMKRFVMKINQKCNRIAITVEQAVGIRNIVIKDKIIKNYSRMNNYIDRITDEYEAGATILALSAKYDFPPLNLLRGILIKKRYSQAQLYNIFANKASPVGFLSAGDLQQYKLAERNDAESIINQHLAAEVAADNEARVVKFFKQIGIKCLTQDDLSREQMKTLGRAVLTPDILFLDEVYINGARVHWIDYKDYIGTNIRFLYTSNVNQAAKYTEKWGEGALCYRKAFVDDLIIPGAILLDGRALPITYR